MKMGWNVAELAMEEEVLIRPLGNVIVVMPPIGISIEDLKKLLRVTYKAIKKATEGLQWQVLPGPKVPKLLGSGRYYCYAIIV